jgi:hypothetical protein
MQLFVVVLVPSARRPGEVVIVSARAVGVRAAQSAITIHFDADCKIIDINALLDWYVIALNSNYQLAYSHVGYYDFRRDLSVQGFLIVHHAVRWIKRNLLGVPTTRGSNYAINRELFLKLYDGGKLSADLQIGPAAKLAAARIIYSGRKNLHVLTSGRKLRSGWFKLARYFWRRFYYNLKTIPVRNEDTSCSWDGFDYESSRRESKNKKSNG